MEEKQNSLAMLPLLLAFFVAGSLGTFAASALPELQRQFSISTAEGSLLYVVWGFGIVAGCLISARAITRYGPASILACAALAGALATHASVGTDNYAVFLLTYACLGATSGAIITTGHGFVGRRSNMRRASNISALDFALSLGTVVAPMLVTYFASQSTDASGWRDVLATFEACLFLFTAVVAFLNFGGPLPSPPSSGLGGGSRVSLAIGPVLTWFAFVCFFHHAFEYGHTYWFVTYGAAMPGIGVDKAREILVGFLSGVIVSRMVLSWLSTEEGLRHILSVSVAIALALIVFMPSYRTYTSLYLANVAFGVAVGVVFPSLLAIAVSTSDRRGAVFSSVALISGALGAQLSALLLGAIIQWGKAADIYLALAIIGIPLLISVNLLIRHCMTAHDLEGESAAEDSV